MNAKEWFLQRTPEAKETWDQTGHDDSFMCEMMERYAEYKTEEMKYEGKLYGKLGSTYFDTGRTSEDWDELLYTIQYMLTVMSDHESIKGEKIEAYVRGRTVYNKYMNK